MNRRLLIDQLRDLYRVYERGEATLGDCLPGSDHADDLADQLVEVKDAVMELLPTVINQLEQSA